MSVFVGCLGDNDPVLGIGGQVDGSKEGGTFNCTLPNTISTFQLGTIDDWDPNIAESPLPNVPTNLMGIVFVSKDTDSVFNEAPVVHHFSNLGGQLIVDAKITIQTRTITGMTPNSDILQLMFHNDMNLYPTWNIPIGQTADSPYGMTEVLHLDELPTSGAGDLSTLVAGTTSLTSALNTLGYIDIVVSNAQQVDYVELELCVRPPPPLYEGSFDCPAPHSSFSFFLGTNDNWDPNIAESPLPIVTSNLLQIATYAKGTDDDMNEASVAHQFGGIAAFTIVDASLTIQTRTIPTEVPSIANLILLFSDDMTAYPPWEIPIGQAADPPSTLTQTLHLDELPTNGMGDLSLLAAGSTDIISILNTLGYLDIIVQNDQEVDYVELEICMDKTWVPDTLPMPCEDWENPLSPSYLAGDVIEIIHGDIDAFDPAIIDPAPQPRDSLVGIIDWQTNSYARVGSNSAVQPVWSSWGANNGQATLSTFDELYANKMLMTSFTGLPNNIVDARIDFGVKFLGGANLETDSIHLGFTQEMATPATYPYYNSDTITQGDYWDKTAPTVLDSTFSTQSQILTYPYTAISTQMNTAGGLTISLHLSHLHTSGHIFDSTTSLNYGTNSIIQEMSDQGFLDFLIQDDTSVDYVALKYCAGDFDTDGDGQLDDTQDLDNDNDGISNADEGDADPDGDQIPNHLDDDSDGDGILDSVEGNVDTDGDGIPDFLDLDSDGDGIPDSVEGTVDTDGDGIPDYLDLDSDGDGIPDSVEGVVDSDGDGIPDYIDSSQALDSDGDGIPDSVEGTVDTDGDGTPDYLDTDSDGDGIPDSVEGNVDSDGDGIPDYLDPDSDGDGIPDSVEGVVDSDGDGTPDYLDLDSDGDGIPDSVEGVVDSDGDGRPDYLDDDSDGDGILDSVEGVVDSDGDGIPDYLDLDSDGDGIPDSVEGVVDSDGDGTPDYLDPDSDGDGIPDSVEGVVDSDGDGTPDYLDDDSDGDGILDSVEGVVDSDGDGIPDYLDTSDDTDTDGDGMPDVWESSNGLDPNDSNDAGMDADNDGLTNLEEYGYGTDPNNADTDGGGVNDGDEITNMSDPNNNTDDGDING